MRKARAGFVLDSVGSSLLCAVWVREETSLPLEGFAPNGYALRVEARRLLSDPRMTASELEFRIR